MSGSGHPVTVLGSGVIGLTTAVALQEAGFGVRIVSGASPEASTSAVAGATWFPYRAHPADRVLAWSAQSRTYFDALAGDPRTGVRVRESLQLWREELTGDPWWAAAVPDVTRCDPQGLPAGFGGGYLFTQPVIRMPVYLRYLAQRFRDGGGTVSTRTVNSLAEWDGTAAEANSPSLVVNCTGLAAGELTGDAGVTPVRGQWVRVANPGISRVIADFGHPEGEAYVIPHDDCCILGGTAEDGAWDTTPDMATAADIVRRCNHLDPRLPDAAVLEHRAGLRPVRPAGVRLELSRTPGGHPLVHNYGHGGCGVTLSWGCAEEVVALARDTLNSPASGAHASRTTTG